MGARVLLDVCWLVLGIFQVLHCNYGNGGTGDSKIIFRESYVAAALTLVRSRLHNLGILSRIHLYLGGPGEARADNDREKAEKCGEENGRDEIHDEELPFLP